MSGSFGFLRRLWAYFYASVGFYNRNGFIYLRDLNPENQYINTHYIGLTSSEVVNCSDFDPSICPIGLLSVI